MAHDSGLWPWLQLGLLGLGCSLLAFFLMNSDDAIPMPARRLFCNVLHHGKYLKLQHDGTIACLACGASWKIE